MSIKKNISIVKSIPECVIVSVNVTECRSTQVQRGPKPPYPLQNTPFTTPSPLPGLPPSCPPSIPSTFSSFPYSRTYLLRPFLGALVLHALGRDGGNSCSYNMRLLSLTFSMLSLQQTHQVKKAMYMHHSAKQMGLGLIFFFFSAKMQC